MMHYNLKRNKSKQVIKACLAWISLVSVSAFAGNCHPKVNLNQPQYIIGYGSLMNKKSKLHTDKTAGPNIPVEVMGLERGWLMNACPIVTSFSTTFLGVRDKPGMKMAAVVYRLAKPQNVSKYDRREGGYCREAVSPENVRFLGNVTKPQRAQYWVYVPIPKTLKVATKNCPIVESYVDLFLDGCLALQKKYHLKNVTTHPYKKILRKI